MKNDCPHSYMSSVLATYIPPSNRMKTSRCHFNCTSAIRGILITASFLSRSSSRQCSDCTHRFLQIDQLLCTSLKYNYSSGVVRSKQRLVTSPFHYNSFYTSFSRSCNTVPVSISYNAVHPRPCIKRTIQKQLTNGASILLRNAFGRRMAHCQLKSGDFHRHSNAMRPHRVRRCSFSFGLYY